MPRHGHTGHLLPGCTQTGPGLEAGPGGGVSAAPFGWCSTRAQVGGLWPTHRDLPYPHGPHPRAAQGQVAGPACEPGRSPEEDAPEDLGCVEGPPGRQVLPVGQHTGLSAHEEEVLTSLPWDVHQIAEGSRAEGRGPEGYGGDMTACWAEPSTPYPLLPWSRVQDAGRGHTVQWAPMGSVQLLWAAPRV